jgi:hypothetical protein
MYCLVNKGQTSVRKTTLKDWSRPVSKTGQREARFCLEAKKC